MLQEQIDKIEFWQDALTAAEKVVALTHSIVHAQILGRSVEPKALENARAALEIRDLCIHNLHKIAPELVWDYRGAQVAQ